MTELWPGAFCRSYTDVNLSQTTSVQIEAPENELKGIKMVKNNFTC